MRIRVTGVLPALVAVMLFSCSQAFAEPEVGLADMSRLAAAEGLVLLKNDNRVLPLDPGRTVSIFGRIQVDYFACGYGSGGDVNSPYKVNILDAMRMHPGITVNEELAGMYEAWCRQHPPDNGSWGSWPRHHPEMPLDERTIAEAAAVSDTAIVVIGHSAGEDREAELAAGSYYLTDAENELLDRVDRQFKKIVVLVNSGNIIDMSWVDSHANIDSVLYIWQGGMKGGSVVADILSGDIPPSGKLSATIAKNYKDYPTSGQSGGERIFGGRDFSNYVEDIYVGYRYFETFAKDAVLYPFGYGLGYTDFEIKVDHASASNGVFSVDVAVKNMGESYSGKEVVQVYYGAPQGRLGKAEKSLIAYAKTKTLAPGECEQIRLLFRVDDMASYDDAGVTGHASAYVLEAGEYPIYVGNSVRSAVKAGAYVEHRLRVTEQLKEVGAVPQGSTFKRMKAVRNKDGSLVPRYENVPARTVDLSETIAKNLPRKTARRDDRDIKLIDVYKGQSSIEDFIAQCQVEELEALCRGGHVMNSSLGAAGNAGVFGGVTQSLRDKGVTPVTTVDGPAGVRLTATTSLLPIGTALACTWNDRLIEELYRMVGREMLSNQADVLLAPGMNIQRDPLGGRNFEYFSEDPLLTGQMAASVVRGLQSQGVAATPKHFALNNQETSRNRMDARCSERAMREIYLKGFEIVVKTAHPYNIMASYNRVNGVYSHYSYDLCTSMLRDEWGYEGLVMTDWWMQPGTDPDNERIYDNAYRVHAQVDVLMPGDGPQGGKSDRSLLDSYESGKGITLGEIQRCAINTLKSVMKSPTFRRANGLALCDYKPSGMRFLVKQGRIETPRLESLSLDGELLATFNPLVLDYTVYTPDATALPKVAATAADGFQVAVVPPNDMSPVATIKVFNDQAQTIYRLYYSNAAGLEPSVKNPVYARVLNVYVNGKRIPEFYPCVYEYSATVPSLKNAVITAEVPEGIRYKVSKDPEHGCAVVRAESPHQAMEYTVHLTQGKRSDPVPDKTIHISSNGSTKLEAEDYIFKTSPLDIEKCEDDGGGMNVGWTIAGNYLLYEIEVAKSGHYTVSPRVASGASTLTQVSYNLEVDGDVVASYVHGGTGGWQNWQSMDAKQIYLEAGSHKLRIYFRTSSVNLNYLRISRI